VLLFVKKGLPFIVIGREAELLEETTRVKTLPTADYPAAFRPRVQPAPFCDVACCPLNRQEAFIGDCTSDSLAFQLK
jgi:hypothetical protein